MRETAVRSEEAPSALGVERRMCPRRPTAFTAVCLALDGGVTQGAAVRDVSAFGAGLLLSRPVPTRALLRIELEGASRAVLARVAHVTPEGRGWLIGCGLVAELGEEGLAVFGAARVPAGDGDARRWKRFPCDVPTVLGPAGGPEEGVAARVVDISAGGLAVASPRRFPTGTLVALALGGGAAPLLARVVRAERAAAGWILGCEFAARLPGLRRPAGS